MMQTAMKISFMFFVLFGFAASNVQAGELTVERQVQTALEQSKALLLKIELKQRNGQDVAEDIARLKELGGSVKDGHGKLQEKFHDRDGILGQISSKAGERHTIMREAYSAFLNDYLAVIENLAADQISPLIIEDLKSMLREFLPERQNPLIGSLPYRNLQLASRTPQTGPVITPAYQGGNTTAAGPDLSSTAEAPITLEIAQLAEALNWSPVEIYGWVKNNIKSEWYWGTMKGAEETLRQRSGNDADQAALLVALYRSAGYPARYVRGVVEFFPDLAVIQEQTGITDVKGLLSFFQKAGIACQPIIAGGKIANIQIEHIWVEALIPYANYRGAILDEQGKTWLGLDTHIKSAAVNASAVHPLPAGFELTAIRDQYLQAVRTDTPLNFLRARVEQEGAVYDDLLLKRTQTVEDLKILPASMQFRQVAVTGEFTEMPVSLKHRLRFVAMGNNRQMFDATFEAMALGNHAVAVAYEPATVEDQEIINSYGGLANTPAYLVHLRPVLTVDGARLAIGDSGLPVGDDFTLVVEMIGPNHTERLESRLTIGNLAVLGLTAQQAVLPEAVPVAEANAERRLYERAMDYIARWNAAEDELAALLHIELARPLPTMVVLGGVVDVAYLLDTPHGFDWKGVYIDAALRVTETTGSPEYCRLFMQLSSLQGSVLENQIFEDGFGVEAISTAKLLGLANAGSLPLVVLDQGNAGTELPGLNLPANIRADIENAINQGLKVTIPELETQHEDWLGYGYLKEDPATGESGWMLSGMIAGGMTALNPERWPAEYYDSLANPFQGEVNHDPDSAVELLVLAASEWQQGVAGKPLPQPLQLIARDTQQRPVPGVQVNFRVLAGGGRLSAASATTDGGGIASVNLTLGQRIADNPTYWHGSPHSWLIGENIIEVVSSSGLRPKNPFTAYALPGEPKLLTISGDQVSGEILSWSTTLIVRVEDEYHNAISNVPVSFSLGEAIPRASCVLANADSRKGALVATTDACLNTNIPVLGDCGAESLAEQTSELGAVAQVILGGVPDADYPITITASGFPERVVTVTSRPFGNCNGELPPQHDLVIKDINLTDRFGNNFNAAGIGKSIPLLARMYAVSEEGQTVQKQSNCFPGDTATCPYFVGTRQYQVNNDFSSVEVAFAYRDNADQAEIKLLGVEDAQDKGLFRIANLPVGTTPGRKTVTITGRASKGIQDTVKVCDRYGECTLKEQISPLTQVSFTKEIFAVDIALASSSYAIPVDTEGYALIDTLINYTILPADYAAGNAMVMFYQRNPQGEWEPPFLSLESESRGNGFVTLARGFRFDSNKEYKAQVALNGGFEVSEVVSSEITLQPVPVNLALRPDYNRDGKIDESDEGMVTPEKPWRFWVNDDDDGHADANGIGSSANDLPSQNKDNRDGRVNGIRDLIDFFPVKLELVQALALLPPDQGYRYFLKDSDAAVAMAEGMAGGTILTTEQSSPYLEDPGLAVAFGSLPTRVIDQTGVELSPTFLQAVKDDSKAGIVLLEGTNGSTVPLVLEIRDQTGAVVISQAMPLEIAPVEQMFGHRNLRPEAGGAGGEVDRFVNFSDPSSPEHYLQVKQPYCMQGVEKNLVWMHGFNVDQEAARGTYAEVFKRFFHAGLVGRFYGVSWFGDPSGHFANPTAPFSPHYHQAAVNAFATAGSFAGFVGSLPGATSIAAHSLGNLLAGEAVQNGLSVANYFAVDAAVALEAYGDIPRDATGQVSLNADMVNVENWPDYIAAGQTRLLASEWHRAFGNGPEPFAVPPVYPPASPPADNRESLSWRGRLAKVPSLNVYNFFSSTEDVLRTYPDDDLVWDGAGANLGMSSWVKQEKFKGRRDRIGDVPQVGMDIGGASSNFCGWSFNSEWNHWFGWGWRLTPAEAAEEISDEALKTKPFFALDKWHLFTDLSSIVEPNLDNLVKMVNGVAPSDFVTKKVSETELAGYYSNNTAAHAKVVVRDWLLAEAFPATTLPMGANPNGRIYDEQEVNMSGVRDNNGGCCKTSEALWPYDRKGEWKHSDYKDIGYQHVFEFYKRIKELTN